MSAEHYTDTGGATDHVFALCAMLGFRFCPRLRDFLDRRLIPIEPPAGYPDIATLLGKRIRVDIIREHWDEVIRLVASLKAGPPGPPDRKGRRPPRSRVAAAPVQEGGLTGYSVRLARPDGRRAAAGYVLAASLDGTTTALVIVASTPEAAQRLARAIAPHLGG